MGSKVPLAHPHVTIHIVTLSPQGWIPEPRATFSLSYPHFCHLSPLFYYNKWTSIDYWPLKVICYCCSPSSFTKRFLLEVISFNSIFMECPDCSMVLQNTSLNQNHYKKWYYTITERILARSLVERAMIDDVTCDATINNFSQLLQNLRNCGDSYNKPKPSSCELSFGSFSGENIEELGSFKQKKWSYELSRARDFTLTSPGL